MSQIDFYVRFDPSRDSSLSLFMKILYAVILRRIKFKKPTVTHISGKSGEGKSLTALYIMYLLLKMQNLDIKDFFDDINITNQKEYPAKLRNLLKNKTLKKVNVLAVHEGREAMEANEWRSLFNRNVAHVNALSRAVKRMAIFIVSQGIKDITKDVRRTLDYQIKIQRPMQYGKGGNARLLWYVMYEDDRDIENVILRKRRLRGILIMPNGKWVRYNPSYISIPMVNKELKKMFEELDRNSKWQILNKKLEEMEAEVTEGDSKIKQKIDDLVNYYIANESARQNVLRINKRNHYKATDEFRKIHDLNPTEVKDFEALLKTKLEEQNGSIA